MVLLKIVILGKQKPPFVVKEWSYIKFFDQSIRRNPADSVMGREKATGCAPSA